MENVRHPKNCKACADAFQHLYVDLLGKGLQGCLSFHNRIAQGGEGFQNLGIDLIHPGDCFEGSSGGSFPAGPG